MELVLRGLRLRGFGRFEDVRLRFGPGLNVLARPNEWGKSTVVAGIGAALFGLASSSRAASRPTDRWLRSRERFRNWYGAGAFDAVLLFELDGALFQLYRDFDSFRVVLRRREGPELPADAFEPPEPFRGRQASGGWVQLFNGLHNPAGDKTSAPFEDVLERYVGLRSVTVWEHIFCVTQRLPELDQLDAEVQALITGAGTAGLDGAREWLGARARGLTMRSGDLGLTPGNSPKPQRLEQIEERLRYLQQAVAAETQRLDRAHQVKQALAEAEAALREARQQQERTEALVRAWREWLERHQRRRQMLGQAAELEVALRRARVLEDRLAELRRQGEAEWADLGGLPAEAPALLERLREMEGGLAQGRARLDELARLAASLEGEQGQLLERMAGEYGELWGRPDLAELPARHEELVRRARELSELEAHLAGLEQEERELRQRLQQMPDWSPWLPSPLASVGYFRDQADQLVARWEELQQVRRQLAEAQDLLHGRFDVLQSAPPAVQELLPHYDATLRSLRLDVERATAALESARQRLSALREAEAAWRRHYSEVLQWQARWGLSSPAEVAAHLGRRMEQVRRRQRLAGALDGLERRIGQARAAFRRMAWLAAAGVALVAAAVGLWVGGERGEGTLAGMTGGGPPLALGLGGTVALAAGLAFARRASTRRRGLEAEAQGVRRELQAIDESLAGAGLGPDEGWIAAAIERASACARELERLEGQRAELQRAGLDEHALGGLEQAAAEAERALASFLEQTAPVRARFGDAGVARAWAEYCDTRARVERLAEHRDRISATLQQGHEGLREWLLKAGAPAAGGVQLIALEDVASAEALAAWLKGQAPPDLWERAEASAAEWSRIRDRLAAIEVERKAAGRLARLREELDALRKELAPFDEGTPPEGLRQRVQACLDARAHLERLALQLAATREEQRRLASELEEAQARRQALERPLLPLLRRARGDLDEARRLLEAKARHEAALRDLERELSGLLSGLGVDSVAGLEARRIAIGQQLASEGEAMERLRQAFPALPPPDDDRRAAELQQEYEAYEARAERLRREVAAAQDEQVRLARNLAALEGTPGVNVARAQSEMAELERERARVQREIEALVVAHRWLEEAATEYHEGFRRQLEEWASRYFSAFTGVEGRRVILDHRFRLKVAEPDGQEAWPAVLSQGARDQLYLALRFAMAAMVQHRLRLPFVLDDPFLNCDAERLRLIRQALEKVAPHQQVLLLSHRQDLASWGAPVEVE